MINLNEIKITPRDQQVLHLLVQGCSNKEIAAVLRTSEQVVKNYLRTTFDKLGVWTRLELALYVASHGGTTWQRQFGSGVALPPVGWSAGGVNEAVPFADGEANRSAAATVSGGTG